MAYPNSNIDPNSKDEKFVLAYAKQAWNEGYTRTPGMFYAAATEYKTLKNYATGQQDTKQYQAPYLTDQYQGRETWVNLKWDIRPVISKYRDIAIGRIAQRGHNITAMPIDPLAKGDEDKYFSDAKVKIMMRDALKKANPELLENPNVKHQQGEPEDLEELEMQMSYGWKHNMAIMAEMCWQLAAYKNDFTEERKQTIINWYDLGVGGYKEYIDVTGETRIRSVDPGSVICSYCGKPDFRDAMHIGEVIDVNISELKDIFTVEELKKIQQMNTNVISERQNPSLNNRATDKIYVLDLEFLSNDIKVFSQRQDKRGNVIFGKDEFKKKANPAKVIINGREVPKYSYKEIGNVYKVKWIIGTDYVYDYGVATNQKRDKSDPAKPHLSYHLYAYDFHNMTAGSIVKRLRSTLDEYQATYLKIQHFKNKWIPYIISIDMDALENVALGKGGQEADSMTPIQLLDMMFQTNLMLTRKTEGIQNNVNYKAVEVMPTPMAQEFGVLVQDLARILQDINDLSGLNEFTNGGTPNPKALVPGIQAATDATNNSQFPIIYADKAVMERLAKGVIQRIQVSVKGGKNVEGFVHAFGSNALKFVQVSPDIALHEFGIMVEDRPTDAEKALLLQDLNMKNSQGMINPEDYVMVKNTQNLKQAEQLLAYKVKKKREKDQQDAMAMQQQNGQIQIQSAQAAEAEKRKTIELTSQTKIAEIQAKGAIDIEIAKIKADVAEKVSDANSTTKLAGTVLQHNHEQNQTRAEQGLEPTDNGAGLEDLAGMMGGGEQPEEEMDPELAGQEQEQQLV